MPDFPTNLPPADWYTDPSNPNAQRWWGGLEWTDSTRPMPVAQPLPAQVSPTSFAASVPGGGVNPFANEPAEPAPGYGYAAPQQASPFAAAQPASQFAIAAPVSPFAAAQPASPFAAAQTGSPFAAQTGSFPTQAAVDPWAPKTGAQPAFGQQPYAAQSYGQGFNDAPSNGFATAGLVLSLLNFSVFGIIFSILGLRKANGFDQMGYAPVGRKRSRWGLGLGIASIVISLLLGFFYYSAIVALVNSYYLTPGTSQNSPGGLDPDTTDPGTGGDPTTWNNASYDRTAAEADVADFAEFSFDVAPDSVTCPDAPTGPTIDCTIITGGETHIATITIDDTQGTQSISMDTSGQ